MAANTILKLVEEFSLSGELREMVWQTFMFACSMSPELMIGRHMDHIVLSSLYVVCKVNNCDKVNFNIIINE